MLYEATGSVVKQKMWPLLLFVFDAKLQTERTSLFGSGGEKTYISQPSSECQEATPQDTQMLVSVKGKCMNSRKICKENGSVQDNIASCEKYG